MDEANSVELIYWSPKSLDLGGIIQINKTHAYFFVIISRPNLKIWDSNFNSKVLSPPSIGYAHWNKWTNTNRKYQT